MDELIIMQSLRALTEILWNRANIKVFVKSGNTTIISLEYKLKSKIALYVWSMPCTTTQSLNLIKKELTLRKYHLQYSYYISKAHVILNKVIQTGLNG